MVEELSPPRKSVELEDAGAHPPNMAGDSSDDSSDRFTDASEGRKRDQSRSSDRSPVPITRVERLDDEPAYGEIPGTDAYKKRTQDAVPDEVEVITRSRSTSRVVASDRPSTPQSRLVPRIIAERIDPDKPAYGEEPGTPAYEKRRMDAVPDAVVRSPISGPSPSDSPFAGSPTASMYRSPGEGVSRTASRLESIEPPSRHDQHSDQDEAEETEEDDDGFGDDFDDFEEGQEADDFGEFDDGFQQGEAEGFSQDSSSLPPAVPSPLPAIPVIDWSDIDTIQELREASHPQISELFPKSELVAQIQPPPAPSSTLLSDRSLSLYTQLIAPPPLAPPDWLRSRIRRLFLVSLGVPVDLDEILPASKQKKLILPSINFHNSNSPRPSSDNRPGGHALSRLKGQNESSASLDSSGNKKSRRKKEEAQEPQFDTAEARRLAETTEVKLEGLSDEELHSHVEQLQLAEEKATEALLFWEQKKESAIKEKEAFEGVIENLVKHARKVRK